MAGDTAMTDNKPLHPFAWDIVPLDVVLCEGSWDVTAGEIERFRALMGYAPTPPGEQPVAPTSMGLTYGLRLGTEHNVFPPGAVRMGDENRFGLPARAGDHLVTQLRIAKKFEKKERRFMKYDMTTRNQDGALVCSVCVTVLMP